MTSDERFVPDSPVVDAYLRAAAQEHQGHKALDLATWYAISQNYINRHYIQFLGEPFRVHFFLVANSRFGKSSSLDFGFVKFLREYRKLMQQDEDEANFIDLSGQLTAAGLIDAFNAATDPYKRQIVTAWVDETTYLFPKFMGRREQDVASLLSNVFFGRRDVRHVRERGKKLDSVDRPVINAAFPATPDQYVDLMKGASSSDLLKRFMLLSPNEGDGRVANSFTRYAMKMDEVLEKFCQWQNFLDMNGGTPTDPHVVNLSEDACSRAMELFTVRCNNPNSPIERDYFATKQNSTLMVAALNALSRCSFEVSVEDVELAWSLLKFGWEGFLRLESEKPMVEALSVNQKQRRAIIDRMRDVIVTAGKKGATRTDIRHSTWAMRYLSADEIDELFAFVDAEVDDIFGVTLEAVRKNGRKFDLRYYFSKAVWSPEEACAELPLAKPAWSAATRNYVDALGNTHEEITACIGYRPEWGTDVRSESMAS